LTTDRILFAGDFSGLSLFLSRGVADCGVDSILYSNGDGWKGIPALNPLFKTSNNLIIRSLNQLAGAKALFGELRSSDTLVLATEFLFSRWIDAVALQSLVKKARRTILLHAGCSHGFHELNQEKTLCLSCKRYDLKSAKCVFSNSRWPGLSSVLRNIDLIVPFTDIYVASAAFYGVDSDRISQPLHFPVDFSYVSSLVYDLAPTRGVVHGQNRPGFKGTSYLHGLMETRPTLSSMIEFLPRMSFVNFIRVLGASDIVLDQLFANGYGMTGALALSIGTSVAFGYLNPEPAICFGGIGCLPVPILGDPDQDAAVIEESLKSYLLQPPDRQVVIGSARKRHDHRMIATDFLNRLAECIPA
jgi:hypothetical protein